MTFVDESLDKLPSWPQEERDHSGQRRECEPRGAGKAAGALCGHSGVHREGKGQEDLCPHLL